MREYSDPGLVHFIRTWRDLASEGWCDQLGGAEYKRVLAEWEKARHPDPSIFIKNRANIPAITKRRAGLGLAPEIAAPPAAAANNLAESAEQPTDMNLFWHTFVQRLFEERLHISSLLQWLEAFEARLEEENVTPERQKAMAPYFDKAGDFARGLIEELMQLQRSRRRPLADRPALTHGKEE